MVSKCSCEWFNATTFRVLLARITNDKIHVKILLLNLKKILDFKKERMRTLANDLQSKLGDGLSKLSGGIEQGKQKLQTAQEVSRLNRNVNELGQKKSKALLELGQLTYMKIRSGEITDAELVELTSNLVGLDKNIFTSIKKIAELNKSDDNQQACPSCGTVNGVNDKFCGGCGTKLEAEKETSLINEEQCEHCEEMVPSGANFCPCCGQSITKAFY